MKKWYGLLCALTLAASVPMYAADEAAPATEKAAPAATTPAEMAPAPATTAAAAATTETPAVALKTDKEKISYSIGASWGIQLKNVNLDLDMESLFQGMRDAAAGRKLALTDEEVQGGAGEDEGRGGGETAGAHEGDDRAHEGHGREE